MIARLRQRWERFVSHDNLIARPLDIIELESETPAEFAARILHR